MTPQNRFVLIAAALGAAYMWSPPIKDEPDLTDSAWTSMDVRYCTMDQRVHHWRTTDPVELDAMRSSMQPQPARGLTMILTSYTNEILLTQASGQRWKMNFRDKAGKISFHDPDSIKRSFVVDVSEELHAKVSSALTASGGGSILLNGECRID